MKIVIDPGHGGSDPGTVGNGLQEKDVTLAVSNILSQLLRNAGYDVVSTRTTDETVSLLRRSQIAAEQNADLFLSVHINAGGGQGVETYYSITDNNPVLAASICENIAKLGFRNRGAKTRVGSNGDFYSVIRETVRLSNAKPYLIEMFFVDSLSDVNRYREVGNQSLANAIYDAVITDFPISGSNPGGGSGGGQTYTVQRGDTLFSIASRFNTTVDAIKRSNNLTSDFLFIGQQLVIPSGNATEMYIVQPGDTLFSIATRFNTTVDAIRQLNNLTSNTLLIGQQLLIPAQGLDNSTTTFYVVQPGDTLYSIANRFGTTVTAIRSDNNLTSDFLFVGQQLVIVSGQPMNTIHTVQRGDTLFSLANRYGTTVDAIRTANNLTSDVLTIGQQLRIP